MSVKDFDEEEKTVLSTYLAEDMNAGRGTVNERVQRLLKEMGMYSRQASLLLSPRGGQAVIELMSSKLQKVQHEEIRADSGIQELQMYNSPNARLQTYL